MAAPLPGVNPRRHTLRESTHTGRPPGYTAPEISLVEVLPCTPASVRPAGQEMRPLLEPSLRNGKREALLGEQWRALSKAEKARYQVKEKAQYQVKEKAQYQAKEEPQVAPQS